MQKVLRRKRQSITTSFRLNLKVSKSLFLCHALPQSSELTHNYSVKLQGCQKGKEAFAILLYCNSYEVWNQRSKSGEPSSTSSSTEEVDDMWTLSGVMVKTAFKYTGDFKGCQIYRGWSSEGLRFSNAPLGGFDGGTEE